MLKQIKNSNECRKDTGRALGNGAKIGTAAVSKIPQQIYQQNHMFEFLSYRYKIISWKICIDF